MRRTRQSQACCCVPRVLQTLRHSTSCAASALLHRVFLHYLGLEALVGPILYLPLTEHRIVQYVSKFYMLHTPVQQYILLYSSRLKLKDPLIRGFDVIGSSGH